MLYIYVLQVSHIAGPAIPARALRALRSVWSGSRLISPSTTEYNAVAHRAATPLHRARSDWSDWPRCITQIHTYTTPDTRPSRELRGGGRINPRRAAIDFDVTRVSFQSRQIRNGLHHFIKTMRRRRAKRESIRDFSIPTDDAVGRFLFGSPLPRPASATPPIRPYE